MFAQNPFAQHTFEILIMLFGAFFIGLWLGWVLWGRFKQHVDKLQLENQSLTATLDALRAEFDAMKSRAVVAESDNSNLTSQIVSINRNNANLRERVALLEQELSDVQTRNRQVETELGLSFGPDTQTADDIPLEIKETVTPPPPVEEPAIIVVPDPAPITPEATEPLPVPEPIESPAPVVVFEPVAMAEPKPEKPAKSKAKEDSKASDAPPTAAISLERDDLTVVEGIGPKIQMLLNQYGVYTYQDLANTDVARLKEILSTAGPQLAMHDPGTWPSQANLAANDQWDTLKSVQGFLKGGKKPD